jgi:hypothetical protein
LKQHICNECVEVAAITIDWDDGDLTSVSHNDMAHGS